LIGYRNVSSRLLSPLGPAQMPGFGRLKHLANQVI
jgi:hypothetical protein